MRLSEIIRLVWMNLIQNRTKVLLTSLGIIVGSATIVLVIAIGQGGQADVAGIGITQMDGRKGRAVEICIRSADADNIRLLVHEKRLLFSGEIVS